MALQPNNFNPRPFTFLLQLTEELFYLEEYDGCKYFRFNNIWYPVRQNMQLYPFKGIGFLEGRYQTGLNLFQVESKESLINTFFKIGSWCCNFTHERFYCQMIGMTFGYHRSHDGQWSCDGYATTFTQHVEKIFDQACEHFRACASISSNEFYIEFFGYVLRAFDKDETYWKCHVTSHGDFFCSWMNNGGKCTRNHAGDWFYINPSGTSCKEMAKGTEYLQLFENIYAKHISAIQLFKQCVLEMDLISFSETKSVVLPSPLPQENSQSQTQNNLVVNKARENCQFRQKLGPSIGEHTKTATVNSPNNLPEPQPKPDPSNSNYVQPEPSVVASMKCVSADRQDTSSQIGNNSENSRRLNQNCGEYKQDKLNANSCSDVSGINSVSSKSKSTFFIDNAGQTMSPITKTNLTEGNATFPRGSHAIKEVENNVEDQRMQQRLLDSRRKNYVPAFSRPTGRSNSINERPGEHTETATVNSPKNLPEDLTVPRSSGTKDQRNQNQTQANTFCEQSKHERNRTISCSADGHGTLPKKTDVNKKVENKDRDQSGGQQCQSCEEFKANGKNDKPTYSKVLANPAPLNSSSRDHDSSEKKITAKNKSMNNSKDNNLKKPPTTGDGQITTPEVLSKLKDELKTHNRTYCQWVKNKEWLDPKHKEVFQVRIQSWSEKSPQICGIADITTSGFKRVLVRSYGLFGKTALCARIALSWSESKKSQFDICSHMELKYFDGKCTVEEYLISAFVALLNHPKVFHKEAVEKALKTNADKTLIMLDGVDSMNEEGQIAVREFLNDSGIFKQSTIIVASRPSGCIDTCNRFDACVEILGFDKDSFLKHARNNSSQNSKTSDKLKKLNLSYLNGFPLPAIYEVLGKILENKYYVNNFFELLGKILESYAEPCLRDSPNTKEDMKEAFQKFGWVCLDALASRCSSFEVNKLEENLGKHALLILNLGIFWEHRTAETKVMFCHQVFIVYFATLYLRNMWNKPQWKEIIFKKLFCSKDCIGDYFVSDNQSYVVGVLPEIVLSLDLSCNLRAGHFEMCYDVIEKAAFDYAFHPVNLLLKTGEMFLRDFDIVKMNETNGQKYHGIFETNISYLSIFESCQIDWDFYEEQDRNRVFMAFTVKEDHEAQVIVQGIFSQNKDATYNNKMHLEFRLNMAKRVLPFLEKAAGLNLDKSALSTQGKFLLSTVIALASGPPKPATCISVQETYPKKAFRAPTRPYTFYLWRRKDSSSSIQLRYWNPSSNRVMCEEKTLEELRQNFHGLANTLNRWCDSYLDPSILINVL